jgi:hypothetical protein
VRLRLLLVAVLGALGCGARSELPVPVLDGGHVGSPTYCKDAGPTPIMVVTDQALLFRFDPPSRSFAPVAMLGCSTVSTPETMAVAHDGTAYVTYQDGTMYAVSPQDASCAPTAFADGANNGRFGSCFAANPGGQGESFFLADGAIGPNGALLTVDRQSFAITEVGALSTNIGGVELTGTGDGRLFAFGNDLGVGTTGGNLAQLDPTGATVLSVKPLSLAVPSGFAFAFWGGDFYFFTGNANGDSTVSRLAADGSFDGSYALLPGQNTVGAGVSTCAPLE